MDTQINTGYTIYGSATHGPFGTPILVTSYAEFVSIFGDVTEKPDSLALKVKAFFFNRGLQVYAYRLPDNIVQTY